MPRLADHIPAVPPSGIRRLFEIALRLEGVTFLAVGEPDVPLAPHIIEAARAAWAADDTNYGPNGGIPELRRAIVDKLARDNGIHADIEQVWLTIGGTQALYQAMTLTLAAGDEVLLPDPGYTTFTMNARMIGAIPVPYTLRPENGFFPDLDELERIVTDRTRVIIVNSPSNPLGVVYPRPLLERLLEFARRHDLWIISDEVYEYFTYGRPHVSLAAIAEELGHDDDRIFSVFSLSKTYAMTGVRVGYLVTPPGMTKTMVTVQEAAISCVATPDQRAALAALTGPQDAVAAASAHYLSNLKLATALLDERGIRFREPEGAFYLWVDVSHASEGDVAGWAEAFLLETLVAVAPGSAFGRSGEGWIRICLAADPADIEHGLRTLPAPA
ncbi:aminotransferase class I/II-fold pyridoxal phosphate-dependent enzyme [Rathayibacter sp. VKM Ac-2803]|uniref:pyridoxal phosphate-dependent aminotransferase n=1 Tax=Rathayibacter sp. VKM Ac-2803 TaxID=2609256 RepID=UPI00135ABD2C|nr:aminotransferase class I/II-fold pyridoxal phosphate-dependent enzyme [Rathayibacter sp. VKM Ac-2803]MWV50281.1 aminotransferase class I/II-fold pyridoxal phosphate-dependent enzyme [Rathayibacter sp. VKM Ac-2803]